VYQSQRLILVASSMKLEEPKRTSPKQREQAQKQKATCTLQKHKPFSTTL